MFENEKLKLKTLLGEGDSLADQLVNCGADPNIILASSIGGTIAIGLIVLLREFCLIFAIYIDI